MNRDDLRSYNTSLVMQWEVQATREGALMVLAISQQTTSEGLVARIHGSALTGNQEAVIECLESLLKIMKEGRAVDVEEG